MPPFGYTHEYYDETGTLISYDKTYNTGDTLRHDFQWPATGLNVRKLTENPGELTNVKCGRIDIPAMRMADLYRILAEALEKQGKDEALTLINKLSTRICIRV